MVAWGRVQCPSLLLSCSCCRPPRGIRLASAAPPFHCPPHCPVPPCYAGRKHQLRLHCAQGLGAPVLGDARYGAVRSAAQEEVLAPLQRHGGEGTEAAFGGSSGGGPPLFLHCRSLEVKRPGARRGAVQVTAPLPPAWRALLAEQRWKVPPA